MLRWLFQSFQEGIERCCREHMHLIDDKYRVLTNLRKDTHLLDKLADILHRVVRCSVEFVDIERTIFVERKTRIAPITRLRTHRVLAVYRLCKDSRTGGFSYTTRSAKEVGVSQLTTLDSIF